MASPIGGEELNKRGRRRPGHIPRTPFLDNFRTADRLEDGQTIQYNRV